MPKYSRSLSYAMYTSVRSVAGAPSSGRRCTNSVICAAPVHDASSRRPSMAGGVRTRTGLMDGPCADAVPHHSTTSTDTADEPAQSHLAAFVKHASSKYIRRSAT